MSRNFIFLSVSLALLAFAGNSLLGRLALDGDHTGALTFSLLRHISAAASLVFIFGLAQRSQPKSTNLKSETRAAAWQSSLWLLAYAVPFAIAYKELAAGTGALVLFGSVQVTMIGLAILKGERPPLKKWLGLFTALSGITLLFLPGAEAPSLSGALLMSISGVAWGAYSLRGKKVERPLLATRGHFMRGSMLLLGVVILLKLLGFYELKVSTGGAWLAFFSGAITSGIGYALWYAVLPHLNSSSAATLQLLVPVLAVAAGVIFLQEEFSLRVGGASVLILAGVFIWLNAKSISKKTRPA